MMMLAQQAGQAFSLLCRFYYVTLEMGGLPSGDSDVSHGPVIDDDINRIENIT
jgi:hypothetical protein